MNRPAAFSEAPFSPVNAKPRPMLSMQVGRPRPGAAQGAKGKARDTDPYGIKAAEAQLTQANGAVLAGYDTAAADTGAAAEIEAKNLQQQGYEEEGAALARMGRETRLQEEAEATHAQVQQWVDESARLNEQLSKEQIDPAHAFADSNLADKSMMMIGGVLGGLLSVQPGQDGRNHFVDQMNSIIERDIRAQESNLANKRASLAQRDNLLGQYMKIHGDLQMAKMQVSDRLYQSSIQSIEGRMKQSGSALVQARGKLAIDGLLQKKSENQQQLATTAAEKAYQRQRQAIARADAARAARVRADKEAFERNIKERETRVKEREVELKKNNDPLLPNRKVIGDAQAEQLKVQGLTDPLVAQIAMRDAKGNVMLDANGRPMIDPNKQLPGVSPLADIADSWWFRSGTTGKNMFLDDQAVKNRQSVNQMGLAYRNMITGAGGSKEEAEEIREAFMGAKTTAEVNAAIQRAQELSDRLVANAKATAGPEAAAQYETNMNDEGGARMPGSFAPKK